MHTFRGQLARLLAGAALFLGGPGAPASAARLEVRLDSTDGAVAHAVVHAKRVDGGELAMTAETEAVMDQQGREFVPHVLPIVRGTVVRFPNSDDTRHHVYSFSDAKTFELQLYHGRTADPVTFQRTGVVTLGCNIHDWMLGFILVLDTPAFARTGDDGRAVIDDLPAGRYRVEAWHHRLQGKTTPTQHVVALGPDERAALTFEAALSPPPERDQRGFGGAGAEDGEDLEQAFEP